MRQTLTRSMRDGISRLGLGSAAFWLYGKAAQANPRSVVANARYRREGAPDGLPIPPSDLIFLVAGTADISWFLDAGAMGAATVKDALKRQRIEIQELGAVLDFGCGCGRVMSCSNSVQKRRVCRVDYKPVLIEG